MSDLTEDYDLNESPILGFTPELKKFSKKKDPDEIIEFVKSMYSEINDNDYILLFRSLYKKSKNVCLYPKFLEFLLQNNGKQYTKIYDIQTFNKNGSLKNPGILNKAITGQHYLNVIKNQSKDTTLRIRKHNMKLFNDYNKNLKIIANQTFNKNFRLICDKNLIVFPIIIFLMDVSSKLKYTVNQEYGSHTIFVIIDKKLNKGYLINSSNYGPFRMYEGSPYSNITNSSDYYKFIIYKSEMMIGRILKKNYPIELVDIPCPQSIDKRSTCAGWTMFLSTIIINEYERSGSLKINPYNVIQKFMTKYNSPEKIRSILNKFYYRLEEIHKNKIDIINEMNNTKKLKYYITGN